MENTSKKEIFLKGILKENPTFVIVLGMCPTLAVTKTLEGALGMSIALIFVLVFSNLFISLIRKIVPNEIRIPVYIVVIATLVSIVEMLMAAYLPALYDQLGVFVALIVVNCIILGRAEAFASKNKPFDSILDALGMGLGFTLAVIVISIIREFFGTGIITVWGNLKLDATGLFDFLHIAPASIFVENAGAFIVLGFLIGIIQTIIIKKNKTKNKITDKKEAN